MLTLVAGALLEKQIAVVCSNLVGYYMLSIGAYDYSLLFFLCNWSIFLSLQSGNL